MEVVGLARQGKLHLDVEKFPVDAAAGVYEKLAHGKIKGRAALIP